MMVAFQYDNGAVGALYYSREIPSLFKGLRLSHLAGRDGIITFESNGAMVLVRGKGLPRLIIPGVRDIRGYRAMYRDFVGVDPRAALSRDEHRARDRRSTAHGRHLREPPARAAVTTRFDIVIIGSGAGGGTMAQALAGSGARLLVIERGDFVPREDQNWDPAAVWKDLRYRTTESWLDERGTPFRPYMHYNVGGNTKFWGSVLYRMRREDFQATEHADGISPAWPIDYETLAPYYDRAERMYCVHGAPRRGSDRAAARRTLSVSARSARAGHGADRRASARAGPASVIAAARGDPLRRGWRLHPVRHLQFVSVQAAHEVAMRKPAGLRMRSVTRTSRCGPTRGPRASSPIHPAAASSRSTSNGTERRVASTPAWSSCRAVR